MKQLRDPHDRAGDRRAKAEELRLAQIVDTDQALQSDGRQEPVTGS